MAFLNQRFFRCTLVLGMFPIKMLIKFTFGSERRVTMRTYRVLQVGSKMMRSSAMLNEHITGTFLSCICRRLLIILHSKVSVTHALADREDNCERHVK